MPLFHRHARGLILTEQGESLNRTVREVFAKLAITEALLTESKEKPAGRLKVTTTVGFGSSWLAPRLHGFLEAYPDVTVSLLLDDAELDLAMREADVAIRMHPPKQPDLVQRHLMTMNGMICASPEYLKKHGMPQRAEDLDAHRLILFGDHHPPVPDINWLADAGRRPGNPRRALLEVNSLQAMLLAMRSGLGIGALPDYVMAENTDLVRMLTDMKGPKVDVFSSIPRNCGIPSAWRCSGFSAGPAGGDALTGRRGRGSHGIGRRDPRCPPRSLLADSPGNPQAARSVV